MRVFIYRNQIHAQPQRIFIFLQKLMWTWESNRKFFLMVPVHSLLVILIITVGDWCHLSGTHALPQQPVSNREGGSPCSQSCRPGGESPRSNTYWPMSGCTAPESDLHPALPLPSRSGGAPALSDGLMSDDHRGLIGASGDGWDLWKKGREGSAQPKTCCTLWSPVGSVPVWLAEVFMCVHRNGQKLFYLLGT